MSKFKILQNAKGEYYWKFVANNGEPICWTEAYASKESAMHAIDLVKADAPHAEVVEE